MWAVRGICEGGEGGGWNHGYWRDLRLDLELEARNLRTRVDCSITLVNESVGQGFGSAGSDVFALNPIQIQFSHISGHGSSFSIRILMAKPCKRY